MNDLPEKIQVDTDGRVGRAKNDSSPTPETPAAVAYVRQLLGRYVRTGKAAPALSAEARKLRLQRVFEVLDSLRLYATPQELTSRPETASLLALAHRLPAHDLARPSVYRPN